MSIHKAVLGALGLVALALVVWAAWNHDAMSTWKQQAGPVSFFGAMALLPAVGAPITPFFVLAGARYGVALGLLGSVIALGLNLALCYAIARSALRSRLEALLQRFEYELPDFQERGTGALRFTMLVKMAPGAPAVVKNYMLGLTGVPFPVYFGVSMLVTGGYGVVCVVLGVSLFEHEVARAVGLGAALVLGLGACIWWWRKRSGRTVGSGMSIAGRGPCASATEDSHARPPARRRFELDAPGSRKRRFESM